MDVYCMENRMTVDFTQPVLVMPDGSYVVITKDPMYPYNVLPGDPLMPSITAWITAGNVAQPYVPPAAIPPTPVQQAQATIAAIQAKFINAQIIAANATSGLTPADVAAYQAAQAVLAGGNAT